jgi:membrane protein YqaA with SNARE-associated domain
LQLPLVSLLFGLVVVVWKPFAANAATLPNDIVSAIMTAAINNVMRFLIFSHLLSLFSKNKQPTISSLRR